MAGGFTAVKNYNETCVRSDDCFDDRMVCSADEENVMRCFCNKYHNWDESIGCVQIYSISYIMNQTISISDNQAKVEKEQNAMYQGSVYSVFFMLFVLSLCTVTVLIYCCHIRRKDHRLKMIVKNLNERKEKAEILKKSALNYNASTSQC